MCAVKVPERGNYMNVICKTKCKSTRSRDQNAGLNHSMRIDNSTFERVEDFKYLGTNLTHQNSIPEESFVFQVAIQKFKDQDI